MTKNPSATIAVACILLIACNTDITVNNTSENNPGPKGAVAENELIALPQGYLRTDGLYYATMKGVDYFIRFMPEGNAIIAAGMGDSEPPVPELIDAARTREVPNVHNVPIRTVGDSIHFVTHAMKGDIVYHGYRHGLDSVTFRKVSHINGREAVLTYVYQPFGSGPE